MGITGKNIVLGVTGGIAAYKAAELTSLLVKNGASVHVVMTEAAENFVGAATFQALTGHRVFRSVFIEEQEGQIAHIDLADQADLVLIAPATANTLARMAAGIADDMLTTVLLAAQCPVWIAPAMNVHMYQHPALQKNIETLKSYGYRMIGPDQGRLACGWTGKGRMAEPAAIFSDLQAYFTEDSTALDQSQRLKGKRIVVTAGPTREAIDPIRFFSNLSTGKMGYAIAAAAVAQGADVTLISGPVQLAAPANLQTIQVTSACEMREAVLRLYTDADAVIQTAAVADYRPETVSEEKIKKKDGPLLVKMVRNPDILRELGEKKGSQILIGFAAETEHLLENGRKKLEEKHLDLLVANLAADSFGNDSNKVTFVYADGRTEAQIKMAKEKLAAKICRTLGELLGKSESQ
ncbi:MAG: bifunctional phosphopantothenoylcysteine decarboxylase/phosphopantothenate--cysteine ligase CoaBC [Sporolactobacillus sp.]